MSTETHTFVEGRSQRNALLLLTAAAELGHDKFVVETQFGGYRVPSDVAERFEALTADLEKAEASREGAKAEPDKDEDAVRAAAEKRDAEAKAQAEADAEPEPTKAPTKKTAARKTAAKKTAAKKTAATKTKE